MWSLVMMYIGEAQTNGWTKVTMEPSCQREIINTSQFSPLAEKTKQKSTAQTKQQEEKYDLFSVYLRLLLLGVCKTEQTLSESVDCKRCVNINTTIIMSVMGSTEDFISLIKP